MKITPSVSVLSPDRMEANLALLLKAEVRNKSPESIPVPRAVAYPPLINVHDHLIGNWFPRSGDHRPYANSSIWVEDMRNSFSYHERNKYWINDGSFVLTEPRASLLAQLGAYKNLFSGTTYVQDHAPVQPTSYYETFPISVVRHYRQCHSITIGNWWGGLPAEEEMHLSHGKMPFIIHLSEGTDETADLEFTLLKKRGLLQPNTLMIHGIAIKSDELKEIAQIGASISWCPTSNFYLIGKTLDIHTCLELGVNVALGTDSTQTGSINLLDEYCNAHQYFPEIPLSQLFAMITVKAAKALYLPEAKAFLNPKSTANLLLIDQLETDPFCNLLEADSEHIQLLLHNGIPLYGDEEWLEHLVISKDYTTFKVGKREKFVIGDPMDLNDQIDAVLGYHKDFPYLPF